MEAHGGRLAVEVLRRHGVDTMFTLSGGHLFVLYDGAVQAGPAAVDMRHEQTATFAAEGWAKVTRRLGCAALTAGPGVTNGVSAMTAAWMNGSPIVVLGGRAPQRRWGAGSLQELDHVPIVAPVTKTGRDRDVGRVDRRRGRRRVPSRRRTPHRGPTFVDIPLDAFGPGDGRVPDRSTASVARRRRPTPTRSRASRSSSPARERPVLVAGGDVYWARRRSTRCARSRRRRASRRS